MEGDHAIQEQQEKVLVVFEAHAIVDPRTMVVHFQDARPTDATMMASVRLVLPTPFAMPSVT
jgi:hypothetical protein